MFPEESGEIERHVGGLPEMIRGNVMSYEPKSMQKAIESANDQMDQKLLGIADRSEEKPYRGTKPLCPKCNFYHDGPCRPKCTNCKRTGHIARDCRSQAANPNYNNHNRRAIVAYQGESGESKSGWEWKCGGKIIWPGYCRRKPKRQCHDG
nr:hypothetical protein [Tanacetum cinerariifolium]